MEDRINISLDSEQADLIVKALQEFGELFYERSRFDGDSNTPRVRRALDVIEGLKYHLKNELARVYHQ